MADNFFQQFLAPTDFQLPDAATRESFIRQTAANMGIDPNVAVRVAQHEGLQDGTWQSSVIKNGVQEPSFGDFQLYDKGLGAAYQQATGKSSHDPRNWQDMDRFALQQAQQRGWGPWYGAKAAGITGRTGIGSAVSEPQPMDMARDPTPAEQPTKANFFSQYLDQKPTEASAVGGTPSAGMLSTFGGWANYLNPATAVGTIASRLVNDQQYRQDAESYIAKTAANVPGSAAKAVETASEQLTNPVGSAVQGGIAAAQGIKDAVANPQATVSGLVHSLSPQGVAESFQQDPVGSAISIGSLAIPGAGEAALAEKSVVPRLASIEDLKKFAGAGINVAGHSGITLSPDFSQIVRQNFTKALTDQGYKPRQNFTGSSKLEQVLTDYDLQPTLFPTQKKVLTFGDLVGMNKDLNRVLRDTPSYGEGSVVHAQAGELKSALAATIEGIAKGAYKDGDLTAINMTPQEAAKGFQEANAAYAAGKRGEELQKQIELAKTSASQFVQSGVANGIKREARKQLRAYINGNPGRISPQDLEGYKRLANPEGLTDEFLLGLRRHLGGVFGTMLGAGVGSALGSVFGPIGHAVGAVTGGMVAHAAGRAAQMAQDANALREANNFLDVIRKQGTDHLQNMLGHAVYEHAFGTPEGAKAVNNWRSNLGTKAINGASKTLAITVARSVNQPHLVPRIYAEVSKLAQQLPLTVGQVQGSAPSQAQPQQQQ